MREELFKILDTDGTNQEYVDAILALFESVIGEDEKPSNVGFMELTPKISRDNVRKLYRNQLRAELRQKIGESK